MEYEHIFRSVVAIVDSDGTIDPQEVQFLYNLQEQLMIPQEVFDSAIHEAKQGNHQIHLPERDSEKYALFELLVKAVCADKQVVPEEQNILYSVAARIGMSDAEVENMIQAELSGKPLFCGQDARATGLFIIQNVSGKDKDS